MKCQKNYIKMLIQMQEQIQMLQQELALMQERGDPVDKQIAKQREIQEALAAQANYMRSIGSDQTDILKLSTEWWNIQNAINKLLETSQDGVNDSKEEQLKLEERILAVQEAQAALANAQKERNIRVFNSKTGQWEWVANASDVSMAKDSLKDAQEKLVSGVNIKTINGRSILGSGDMLVANGSSKDGTKHVFVTQGEYDSMPEHDINTIYFVYDGTTVEGWGFGDKLPIILK